jgi:hypothetical protein
MGLLGVKLGAMSRRQEKVRLGQLESQVDAWIAGPQRNEAWESSVDPTKAEGHAVPRSYACPLHEGAAVQPVAV